jgi:CheY-like chemotaxis protein
MDNTNSINSQFEKIKQQISIWLKSDKIRSLSNAEVRNFLLSLKNSANALQLSGIYQVASSMLEQIKVREEKEWQKEDLESFLTDLMNLTNDYESFSEIEKQAEFPRDEKIPLIQIIDDDVTMLIFLKDAFEEKGWMVIANTSIDKAVSQYFDINPDCVIIDVDQSGISGFKMLEDLQKHT